uniref:REC114 meiotic recombination protein n=1 Tax=Electrophorus electricus TaxID=8005 RepID=A0A4W4GCN1_ELEEL
MSQKKTIAKAIWTLKRYGRFLPRAKDSGGTSSWKVFESSESTGKLELMILESGHLLVSQAQELNCGFICLSVFTQGESRMMRLQFDGSNRSEAVDLCRKAVERLQEYLPIGTEEQPAPPPSTQTTETVPCDHQKQTQKHTAVWHFLGLHGLSLPLAYRHCTVPPSTMEALLRLCLLDSGFPAFVEEVENKLKELIQE